MVTTKQRQASQQHSRSQPEGRGRAKPGIKGTGEYYRIVVRPKEQFTTFRSQDVGQPGGLLRVSGKRSSGSWSTQAWLISWGYAHREGKRLVPDKKDAKDLLQTLSSTPEHEKGDIFIAQDRRNVPEREKPTAAQKRAQQANIKKAQAAARQH